MPDTIAFVCPTCRATQEVDAGKLADPRFGVIFCQGRRFHDHECTAMIREAAPRMTPPPIAGAIRPQDVPEADR